jgi:hypothetical protein
MMDTVADFWVLIPVCCGSKHQPPEARELHSSIVINSDFRHERMFYGGMLCQQSVYWLYIQF